MEPLIAFIAEDWMQRVMEQSDKEAKEEINWPILLLHRSVRKLVWVVTSALGVSGKGVPGTACRLMEKYLCRRIKGFAGQTPDREQWEQYRDTMSNQFCLNLVACILLAAKMSGTITNMSMAVVQEVLLKEGYSHSKDEIKTAEYTVFRTLDFHLPLWSTVEIAEFIVVKQFGLTESHIVKAVGITMDLAEFQRNELELHMQTTNPSTAGTSSRHMPTRSVHLCAGAVVATLGHFGASTAQRVRQLAQLTRTTAANLVAIASGISQYVLLIPPKHRPNILKRRRVT